MPSSKLSFEASDHIWLNAAGEGPLPICSADALRESVEWKCRPHLLGIDKFISVPLKLKKTLARLIDVPFEDIILGNSASYGLHILANGSRLQSGDEIISMRNDFPTDILPWLYLKNRGVVVRQLSSKGRILTPAEIEEAVTPKTRVVCLPHVHTFSGLMLDIPTIGDMCRRKGVRLVINISQSAGTMPLSVSELKADAVVCAGYKWLLGPYGTGFCWIAPEWREQLDYNQSYWIAAMSESELQREDDLPFRDVAGARKFDVFGTANFFNYIPWTASVEGLLSEGIDCVHEHIQDWIDQFLTGLDKKFVIISSVERRNRSALVVFSHKDASFNKAVFQKLSDNGIHAAFWKNNIRLSPHLYNTSEQCRETLAVLNAF